MQRCDPPPALSTLSQGDRLLLRTLRALALDIRCQGFRSQFEEACGWAGPEAFRGLEAFIAQLCLKGRRQLSTNLPAAECVTPDEGLILSGFSAAQAGAYPVLDVVLRELLGCEPPGSLAAAACLAAEALALNGLMLRFDRVVPMGWTSGRVRDGFRQREREQRDRRAHQAGEHDQGHRPRCSVAEQARQGGRRRAEHENA